MCCVCVYIYSIVQINLELESSFRSNFIVMFLLFFFYRYFCRECFFLFSFPPCPCCVRFFMYFPSLARYFIQFFFLFYFISFLSSFGSLNFSHFLTSCHHSQHHHLHHHHHQQQQQKQRIIILHGTQSLLQYCVLCVCCVYAVCVSICLHFYFMDQTHILWFLTSLLFPYPCIGIRIHTLKNGDVM